MHAIGGVQAVSSLSIGSAMTPAVQIGPYVPSVITTSLQHAAPAIVPPAHTSSIQKSPAIMTQSVAAKSAVA